MKLSNKYTDEEVGKMFNILNGLRKDSVFGLKHIQKHAEDIDEIISDYETYWGKSYIKKTNK